MTKVQGSGRVVLVVEDDYFVAHDLATAIESCGAYVMGPVATRDQALAFVKEGRRVDVAVVDVNLNGRMAYPVADALVALGVPVVFATGYAKGYLPGRYAGVPHWDKPFDTGALARFLADMPRPAGGRP